MRILIVYASRHGQTQRIVERIARVSGDEGAEVHLFNVASVPRDVVLRMADLVILASPVYFDKHAKAIERFILRHRDALAAVKSVFVSVSGMAHAAETRPLAEKCARGFLAQTGWTPDRVELFAGGEPYTKYGLLTRFLMWGKNRQLKRAIDTSRDYDYTDWAAVDALAREVAGRPAVKAAAAELADV